jgi:carbon-monoxide dehydrogenase small subunit
MSTYEIKVKVNDQWLETQVSATETLLDVLRNKLDAVEVKNGCEHGDCGSCTVLLQGKAVNACLVLAVQADGQEITTVKGIGTQESPHQLQTAFVEHGAIQCGYCTPGLIVTAKALLDENPHPTRQEICEGISGNLCRCTGYTKIVEAIEDAAGQK